MKLVRLLFIFISFSFISCDIIDEESIEENEAYEFQSIQWKNKKNSFIRRDSFTEIYTYQNESITNLNDTITFTITPFMEYAAKSIFHFNDSLVFSKIDVPVQKVSVPDNTSSLTKDYTDLISETYADFNQEINDYKLNLSILMDSIKIVKNTRITARVIYDIEKVEADFLTAFSNTKTGKQRMFDGKWEGQNVSNLYIKIINREDL